MLRPATLRSAAIDRTLDTMRAASMVMLLAACASEPTGGLPDAGIETDATPAPDARELPGAGFGFSCRAIYQPDQIGTECTTRSGEVGWCAVGICRPKCANETTCLHAPGAECCPAGMRAIPSAGEHCFCEPKICRYGGGDLVCRAVDLAP